MKRTLIGEYFEGEPKNTGCFWRHYKLYEVETENGGKYYELWKAWNGPGNPNPRGEVIARTSKFDLYWIFLFEGNIEDYVIEEQLHRFKDIKKIPEKDDYNVITTLEWGDYILICEEIIDFDEYRYYKLKLA
jgi:hypothetical protein